MDKRGISGGDAFKRTLVNAIGNSKIVLFFSSRNSNTSEWTAKEIGIAVDCKKYIIPIRLDLSEYDPSVRFDLINNDYIDYYTPNHRQAENEKLISGLERKLGQRSNVERHKDINKELMIMAEKYRKGYGVPRDYKFSALLYKKAADQGNAIAQCNLAAYYVKGLGVEKDLHAACALYKLAYNGGSALATYKIGEMYFKGEYLNVDRNKAILLYQRAASMGCELAKQELKRLHIDN